MQETSSDIASAPVMLQCAFLIAGTALGTGLQRLVALVGEVEGGRITLAPLHMEHPLLGMTALQQQVQSHYLRAALPELVKLVGSANVLGEAQLSYLLFCCTMLRSFRFCTCSALLWCVGRDTVGGPFTS